jgi:hypothetical protein
MRLGPPPKPTREKRYNWYRKDNDFTRHPNWRRTARLAGVPLTEVIATVDELLQAASKARDRGHVGDFDFEGCAVVLEIPAQNVLAIYRALNDIGWIEQDTIVSWYDRQPDYEDPTAAERQRNKRARDKARRAVALGNATHEQFQMLTAEETAAMEKLAELDRIRRSAIERAREEPPLPLPLTAVKGGRG